jgi:hypothetical protein
VRPLSLELSQDTCTVVGLVSKSVREKRLAVNSTDSASGSSSLCVRPLSPSPSPIGGIKGASGNIGRLGSDSGGGDSDRLESLIVED